MMLFFILIWVGWYDAPMAPPVKPKSPPRPKMPKPPPTPSTEPPATPVPLPERRERPDCAPGICPSETEP